MIPLFEWFAAAKYSVIRKGKESRQIYPPTARLFLPDWLPRNENRKPDKSAIPQTMTIMKTMMILCEIQFLGGL